jgi:hypothetical protein
MASMTHNWSWIGKDADLKKQMTEEAPQEPEERRIAACPSQLQRATRNRETTSALQAAMLPLIQQAGANGIDNVTLSEMLGKDRRNINHRSQELRFLGLIHTYTTGYAIRHFAAAVPVEVAKARMLELVKDRKATRAEKQLATKRKYDAKRRAARSAGTPMEIRAERAKRSKAERQQDAEARAAVRREIAEAKQLAKDLARLAKQEAAKKPKAAPATRKATRDINKLADRYRGTVSVSAIRKPEPKPAAVVDIPEHLIYRAPPKPDRWAAVQGAGVISRKIGEYEGEASAWVQAVVA